MKSEWLAEDGTTSRKRAKASLKQRIHDKMAWEGTLGISLQIAKETIEAR